LKEIKAAAAAIMADPSAFSKQEAGNETNLKDL